MSADLEPLSTDPNDYVFVDVETRSHEDVTQRNVLRSVGEARISPADLHVLLSVCFDTGCLVWRPRSEGMRVGGKTLSRQGANTFNGKFLRESVGSIGPNGYLQVGVLGYDLLAHRMIWAMRFDVWPDRKVDHINGVRTDNRLANFRLVDDTEHARNLARPKHNTSGHVGVCQTTNGRWRAYITLGNRQKHLGVYDTCAEAVIARKEAERVNGFHKNHGRVPHVRS